MFAAAIFCSFMISSVYMTTVWRTNPLLQIIRAKLVSKGVAFSVESEMRRLVPNGTGKLYHNHNTNTAASDARYPPILLSTYKPNAPAVDTLGWAGAVVLPPITVVVVPPDRRPTVGEVGGPDGELDCNVVKTVNVFKDIDDIDDIDDVDDVEETCVDADVVGAEGVFEVIVTDVVVILVVETADVAAVEDGGVVVVAIYVGSSEKKIGVGSPESWNADPLAGEQSQRPAS